MRPSSGARRVRRRVAGIVSPHNRRRRGTNAETSHSAQPPSTSASARARAAGGRTAPRAAARPTNPAPLQTLLPKAANGSTVAATGALSASRHAAAERARAVIVLGARSRWGRSSACSMRFPPTSTHRSPSRDPPLPDDARPTNLEARDERRREARRRAGLERAHGGVERGRLRFASRPPHAPRCAAGDPRRRRRG